MANRADIVVTRADTAGIKADMVGSRATENSRHMGEADKANMAARREVTAEGRNAVVRGSTMVAMVGSGEEMPLREAAMVAVVAMEEVVTLAAQCHTLSNMEETLQIPPSSPMS